MNTDVKIVKDISGFNVVLVWKNGWIQVSKHKYDSDAQIIYDTIIDGGTQNNVKEIISNQDPRCNVLLLKYFENW